MRAVGLNYSTILVGDVSAGEIIPPGYCPCVFFFCKHLDLMEYIRLYIATNGGEEEGGGGIGGESLFSRACASTYIL